MSLRQIIKRNQILMQKDVINNEFVIPGEPMIYSVKYTLGERKRPATVFRNQQWKSILKCSMPSYYNTNTPVVLIVRFFVSPPSYVSLSSQVLKKEKTEAVRSFELCDYLLSFMEILHHVLINSYRQIVKIDARKTYSSNPRITFKFMSHAHYVQLQDNNTDNTNSQSSSKAREKNTLQPKQKGNDGSKKLRDKAAGRKNATTNEGALVGDATFPNACPKSDKTKTKSNDAPQTSSD